MAFAKDYVDVAQRLRDMRAIYPDLTLQQLDLKFITFGGQDWIVYTAAAYRTPDDSRPGIGTAWEPIPGKTPYTKDSEVMVAETSAWGRALVAIGADTKNGIASANEVQARHGATSKPTKPTRTPVAIMADAETAAANLDLEKLRTLYLEAETVGMDPTGLANIKDLADRVKGA